MKTQTVTIPRQEYQELLSRPRFVPVVNLTAAEKRSLDKARREMARGNFVTLAELEHDLASPRNRKRSQKS